MNNIEVSNIIEKIRKSAFSAPRTCLYKGCNKHAINSHLLQKNGIIDQLAEDGKVIELQQNIFKPNYNFFKSNGLNKALSHKGFCQYHDDKLFSSIEKKDTNYKDYYSQLLLSYRATLIEKRKKEINLDLHNKVIENKYLQLHLGEKLNFIRDMIDGTIDGIHDKDYYEDKFLSDMNKSSRQQFYFFSLEIPKIEVCASSIFTLETNNEIRNNYNNRLTNIFFHLIPVKNSSIIIIGCLKEDLKVSQNYIKSFVSSDLSGIKKKISDLLLLEIENWICSINFYQKFIKPREDEVLSVIHQSTMIENNRTIIDFNLFSL